VASRGGRIFDEQCDADVIGADLGDPCPDCGAWHGIRPLTHLTTDEPCYHDRNRPCIMCGEPVGDLSMAGPEICGACAAGRAEPLTTKSSQPQALIQIVSNCQQQLPNTGPENVRPFGRRSQTIPRGLAFATMFALGAASGYGVTVYGPRWAPMTVEWPRLTQKIMDQNAKSRIASDVAIDDRILLVEPGSANAAKGPPSSSKSDDPAVSAALIDPPDHTPSSVRTAVTSARAAGAADRSRELASVAMTRGNEAMVQGDIITARRFYELAASHDLARAAAALGQTYDPVVLREKGVRGILANIDAAKRWYQKAIENGDSDARSRLHKLLGVETVELDH
jgi:hypothetical protein